MRVFIVLFTLSHISFARIIYIALTDSCFSTGPQAALLRCCIYLLLLLFLHLRQREGGRIERRRCTCGYMFVVVNLLVRITLSCCLVVNNSVVFLFIFIAFHLLPLRCRLNMTTFFRNKKVIRSALRYFPRVFLTFPPACSFALARVLTHKLISCCWALLSILQHMLLLLPLCSRLSAAIASVQLLLLLQM